MVKLILLNNELTFIDVPTNQTAIIDDGTNRGFNMLSSFADANGSMYFGSQLGYLYRVTLNNNQTAQSAMFEYLSRIPVTTNADGAKNILTNILVDYGNLPENGLDALPVGYKTLLISNGARHEIDSRISLGDINLPERDGYYDIAPPDNDSISVPLNTMDISETTYSLKVRVNNKTGKQAYVYGWIDFNRNGKFDGNEAVIVAIGDVPEVTLNFVKPGLLPNEECSTGLRLRITTDSLVNGNASNLTLEDTRSYGPANDGEVEDYVLKFASMAKMKTTKTVDKTEVQLYDTITYEIKVENIGSKTANNVIIKDVIDSNITPISTSFEIQDDLGNITKLTPPVNLNTGVSLSSINKTRYKILRFKCIVTSID